MLRYTESRKRGGAAMAGRRICAGYYRRYDSRVVYVISLDTDSSEETVIWTTDPFLGTAPPIKVHIVLFFHPSFMI